MNLKENKHFSRVSASGSKVSPEAKRASFIKLLLKLSSLVCGFLLGGCHIAFGAYPLGLAFVSALPSEVFFALAGVAAGSLTAGKSGVIFALSATLSVFLRLLISTKDGSDGRFSESILLRASAASISAFAVSIYEILISSFSLSSLLFGASTLLLSVLITPTFAMVFDANVSAEELILGGKKIFSRGDLGKEKLDLALLCISALVFAFFISLSLKKYAFFGIDLAYVFSTAVTLFAAKRFGSTYALTLGFFASVGISASGSISFALLGLAAGALFPFGALFALVAGIASLGSFAVYVGGLTGLLSLLPECLIGTFLIYPFFKHLEREEKSEPSEDILRASQDMVGTMALSYRLRKATSTEAIERALMDVSELAEQFIGSCEYKVSSDLAIISSLIAEENEYSDEQRAPDEELTKKAEEAFLGFGFKEGAVKVFGGREKYLVLAAKDHDGSQISSGELHRRLEEAIGVRLSPPHFFRRNDMALMECHATEKYRLSIGKASSVADGEAISGDTATVFSSERGVAFALICDGMGSGECAHATSAFASKLLFSLKELPTLGKSALYLLNGLIRRSGDECAVTVDLFSFDKITGECRFFKAGAAASYIKRDGSVYRIKSNTMPIGVLSGVDGESIRTDVGHGDLIVMLSDGIVGEDTDAPWLIEYLCRADGTPSHIAERITELARHHGKRCDDMSVIAIKILKI